MNDFLSLFILILISFIIYKFVNRYVYDTEKYIVERIDNGKKKYVKVKKKWWEI